MSEQLSAVTLPLKTEKWQSDRLTKTFELCRQVYNSMLGYELKQLDKLKNCSAYKECRAIIDYAYKSEDETQKKSNECKAAKKQLGNLYKEYGFTKFSFINTVTDYYKYFNKSISSMMAGRSIAVPMWDAFEKMLYGNGRDIHFKKPGSWNSIVTDGRSGIRLVNESGETLQHGLPYADLFVQIGTATGQKMKIPVMIDWTDKYKSEMVDRDIHTVRIIRKWVKNHWNYYVQLTVEGTPAPKVDRDGNIKHVMGEGPVGLYINTRKIIAVTPDEVREYRLNEGLKSFEDEKKKLLQFMDSSRRISNPENYNTDGTIRANTAENNEFLTWTYSNNYNKARDRLKNLYRVEKENRRLERQRLSNEILTLGDRFAINQYPFAYAMQKDKRERIDENGVSANKKKAGKVIGENAPSMLIALIDNKLKAAGKEPLLRVSIDKEGFQNREKHGKDIAREMLELLTND